MTMRRASYSPDPLSARAHALLGAAILASGDFQDSVEEFRTALSIQENEALAIAGLAMVDFYENRLDSPRSRDCAAPRASTPTSPITFSIWARRPLAARDTRKLPTLMKAFCSIAPKTDADRRAAFAA